jgi:hypothetical protein
MRPELLSKEEDANAKHGIKFAFLSYPDRGMDPVKTP